MKDIIDWLKSVEHIAGEVYLEAAATFSHEKDLSEFLHQLAEEEAWHFHVMGSAANFLQSEPDFVPAISVDKETEDRIISYFKTMRKGMESKTLSRNDLLEKIVRAEMSEWNDIFTYVVNTLKEKSPEFKYPAARIQSHLKGVEYFLQNIEKQPDILTKISQLPPVWVESILIAEDDPMVANLIKSLLNRDGKIDIAENGKDALELIQSKYYKLIISDIDMPVMDGITLFEETKKVFPNIHTRFLFITGNLSPERQLFLKNSDVQFLAKPMEIKTLREMAYQIILAN